MRNEIEILLHGNLIDIEFPLINRVVTIDTSADPIIKTSILKIYGGVIAEIDTNSSQRTVLRVGEELWIKPIDSNHSDKPEYDVGVLCDGLEKKIRDLRINQQYWYTTDFEFLKSLIALCSSINITDGGQQNELQHYAYDYQNKGFLGS